MLALNDRSRSLVYYLFTGIMVSGLAFINQYPLVYSDTGAYLDNSFSLVPNDDRPIGYGLIIRVLSWQATLWPVVLFQGVVASWLIMLVVREMVPEKEHWVKVHVLLLTFLLLGSSLPWYSAQLMADHYAPLVLIILFLLFRARLLGVVRRAALWLLLFFFMATHNSLFLMAAMLSVVLLVHHLFAGPYDGKTSFMLRWGTFNTVVVGAAIMVASFNYNAHGRFQLSRAGNVFLVGRLCEPGIMADHLRTACEHSDNPFCAYKDRLPDDAGDLLWSEEEFIQQNRLTIGQADSILAPLVADVLSNPEYLARFARSSLTSTFVQLFQWEAGGDLHKYAEGSSPYFHITGKFKDERYRFEHARQQWNYWGDWDRANEFGGLALALSLMTLTLLWFLPRRSDLGPLYSLSQWVAVWVLVNAFVTATFSVVDPRLQARVWWLVPMCAFLIIARSGSVKAFLQPQTPAGAGPM